MNAFTSEELKQIKTLIRLGDSKELAIKTVLEKRDTPVDFDFYRRAYEN